MVRNNISDSFELDLVFNYDSEYSFDPYVKEYEILTKLINDSQYWTNILQSWIRFIRNDKSLACPEFVRLSSSMSMGLKFTDDEKIKLLNLHWRKKQSSTDVLSFPILDESFTLPTEICLELGDIIVSVETAHRQAMEMSHGLLIELRWLVSHGLLHLLGWDHCTSDNLQEMLSLQEHLVGINDNVQF